MKALPKSVDGHGNRILLLYRLSQLVKIGGEFGGGIDTDKSHAAICYLLEQELKAEQLWESLCIDADEQAEQVPTGVGPIYVMRTRKVGPLTGRTVEAMMEFISNHICEASEASFFFTQGTSPLLQMQKDQSARGFLNVLYELMGTYAGTWMNFSHLMLSGVEKQTLFYGKPTIDRVKQLHRDKVQIPLANHLRTMNSEGGMTADGGIEVLRFIYLRWLDVLREWEYTVPSGGKGPTVPLLPPSGVKFKEEIDIMEEEKADEEHVNALSRGKCFSCGKEGHIARACPTKRCMNCLESGHESRTCTNNRRCLICRSEDHLASECPRNAKRREGRPAGTGTSREMGREKRTFTQTEVDKLLEERSAKKPKLYTQEEVDSLLRRAEEKDDGTGDRLPVSNK